MASLLFRNELKKTKIEFKEFLVLFLTITVLSIFAIERYESAKKMAIKERSRILVAKIITLQTRYKRDHDKFGTLAEIGFVNPFADNSVRFVLSFNNGFIIQAKENPVFDSFGDNVPGNEYWIGYSNGSIEFNRKN